MCGQCSSDFCIQICNGYDYTEEKRFSVNFISFDINVKMSCVENKNDNNRMKLVVRQLSAFFDSIFYFGFFFLQNSFFFDEYK